MYVWVKGFGNPAVNYYNQLYVCNNDDSNFIKDNHFFFSDGQPVQHLNYGGEPYLQCYETTYNNRLINAFGGRNDIRGLFYTTFPPYKNYLWCRLGGVVGGNPYGVWNIRNDGQGGINRTDSPTSEQFSGRNFYQGYNLVKV